jgi:hypothetical protein
VEYEVTDQNGRRSALDVTGPFGAFVQGKRNDFEERRPRYDDYDRNDGGGGGGGGYGGNSGGQNY